MASCPAFDPAGPYVGTMLGFVDCRITGMAEDGWRVLSSQNGFGAGLTGLLTIFVALIGYRLILGERLVLREGAGLALRLGLVLALCTQWASWNALAYRVGIEGPQSLANAVLSSGGLGGEDRYGLAARLDRIEDAFDAMAKVDAEALRQQEAQQPQAQPTPAPLPQPVTTLSAEQRKDLASTGTLLMGGALAGLIAVRAVLGLLLALGPLFAASLLFETTRALFAGWVRAMVGAMLAAVAVPMVLALELAVVEPQVGALASVIGTPQNLGSELPRLWTSALVFAAVQVAVAVGAARAASAFRLPDGVRVQLERLAGFAQPLALPAPDAVASASWAESRSRAQRIADAALVAQRRDERGEAGATRTIRIMGGALHSNAPDARPAPVPLGQMARRDRARGSASATRRDSR